MADSEGFVERLQYVLQFLSDHGFEKAAASVYEQLENKTAQEPADSTPAEQHAEQVEHEELLPYETDPFRSKSADPVLLGSRGASQAGDDADGSHSASPWPPGAAEALQTRLSGSSRLYEDPDVDEYSSMEDVGYVRRSVHNQQDFIMHQLDFLRTGDDDTYFHSSSMQRADSCSDSSSASLSSPGMSSCALQQDADSLQHPGDHPAAAAAAAAASGDAAWDSGPAGITFAEPVTTPTQDSQRNSISDLKPSLSRVESLSNSFIEEFESLDAGQAGGDSLSRQDSEAGSIAGDALGTPPRRSRDEGSSSDAGGGGSASQQQQQQQRGSTAGSAKRAGGAGSSSGDVVVDLSPPSPPPDCSADAGIDLSNIFELGLRASSRTSSVDVLQGSVRCWSEPDCDALFGRQQQLDTGRVWPTYSAGTCGAGSNASSRAASTVGPASLGSPGGLVVKPRQSVGASRLQSSSQHEPEEQQQQQDPQQQELEQLLLQSQSQPPQQQQPQQQQVQELQPKQQQQPLAGQEQPTLITQQEPQEQQHKQQGQSLEGDECVLSPTQHKQQPTAKQLPQQQRQDQQQQQDRRGAVSDSGSSGSTAGPVTPTAPAAAAPAAPGSSSSGPQAGGTEDTVALGGSAATEAAAGASAASAATTAEAAAAAAAAAGVAAAAEPDAAAAGEPPCPSSPPAAALGGSNGGGFGFSFPTTPPSAVDAAVHEARAERVFSTWASNHSRSLSGGLDFEVAAGGEDLEADTSSSQPANGTAAAAAEEPAVARGSSSSPEAPLQITLAAPVSPVESPFLAGAALASCSKSSSPAGKAQSRGGSRGGSRAHSSSSAAARAAAAGGSSRSSSRRLSAAGRQQQQQQQLQLAGASSSGGVRSPLGDGVQGPSTSGVQQGLGPLQQQSSAGYDALGNACAPAMDTDAESTGGFSGSGELSGPRYVVDESGNLLYEYDTAYIDNRYEMFDLRIVHRRRRTGFEDSKEFPIRKNDLIAGRYQVMDFLGSAAFSQAVQALDVATGALVCLKIIKNNKDYFDQSLDEIKLLRYVNNADPEDEHHIVRLYDSFYYKEHLILVCELLRANLYEFQKYQRENGDEPYFTPPRIQRIAIQVLRSLAFLHSLGLVHSDLKPENILIKSYSRCEVKVIDLGSSCFITDHLSSYVQSRSYRAPEVILGLPYGQKIDIWSLGCILAELATGYVLFQNDSLATLLARLEGILGPLPSWMVLQGRYSNRYYTRSRQLYERSKVNGRYELLLPKHTSLRYRVPAADEGFLDFLSYLLTPDPSARPSASEALQHPWLAHPYPPVEQIPD